MTDPSLLRFLVDARGEDVSNKQLRDDLMTMLIAGHETTAAVLTWTTFCLMQVRSSRPTPVFLAKFILLYDAIHNRTDINDTIIQNPEIEARVLEEIDRVVGDRRPGIGETTATIPYDV